MIAGANAESVGHTLKLSRHDTRKRGPSSIAGQLVEMKVFDSDFITPLLKILYCYFVVLVMVLLLRQRGYIAAVTMRGRVSPIEGCHSSIRRFYCEPLYLIVTHELFLLATRQSALGNLRK